MVAKVLGKTGVPINDRSMIYKAVVQGMLIYRGEIWVVMDMIMTVQKVLHHRIARYIEGIRAHRGGGGEWEWALVGAAPEVTGLWPIREYIRIRQGKIAEYVVGMLI